MLLRRIPARAAWVPPEHVRTPEIAHSARVTLVTGRNHRIGPLPTGDVFSQCGRAFASRRMISAALREGTQELKCRTRLA